MSAANGPTPQDAVPAMKNGFAQLNNRPIIMTVPPTKVVVAPTTPWWDDREDTDQNTIAVDFLADVFANQRTLEVGQNSSGVHSR